MTASTTRAYLADLEIRSNGDGRTVVGLAAPFGIPAEITDMLGVYSESIVPGAFARTIAERGPERVKVLAVHDRGTFPIGRATSLREDARGLVAELRISKTQAGDEALELVRDRTVDGLSIGFRAIRDRWSSDRTARTLLEIRLDEISLVPWPAYADALVTAVRAATQPNLMAARRRLLELRK